MKAVSRVFLAMFFFAFTLQYASTGIMAGDKPTHKFRKPIQIIVLQAPGGVSDLSARVFADNFGRHVGQNVVVVNTVGAGGSLAAHKVDEAPKDSTTLLYIEEGTLTNYAAGTLDMNWDEFEIIAQFGGSNTQMLATSKNTGITDIESMRKYAEEHGGEVTTAITLGNPTHFQTSAIERATGIKFRPIDVGTGSDKITAIITGQVDTSPGSLDNLQDYIKNDDVRCIGLMNDKRTPLMPNLKTIAEQGYDLGCPFLKFFVIAAPKGTPMEIIEALDYYTKETVEDPATKAAYAKLYLNPDYKNREDTIKFLQELQPLYMDLAKFMGLR